MAITETRSLPPQFVEDLGKDYAAQLTGLTSQKLNAKDFQPMVAGQDQATKDAYTAATQGIGSYTPYLQAAGQFQTGTGTFAGQPTNMMGAQDLVGPNAYQQFMSPYQQDVIDTTLQQFDVQAQKGLPQLAAQAINAGAFGGGREGVQRAEFASQSGRDRAALQAQLLQQGFGQAQQARQQDIQNRFGLGQAQAGLGQAQAGLASQQLGLGQFEMGRGQFQTGLAGQVPQLQRADISTLGQVGAAQQAQSQAELDAARQGARTAAYEPLERLGFFGQGVTGLMGGYPAQYNFQSTPAASPLQTALGLGTGLAGIFGALK